MWRKAAPLWLILAGVLALPGLAAGTSAHSSRSVHGKLRGQNILLPAGQTRIVTGDYTAIATRDLIVNGTLLVKRGADLRLKAGRRLRIGPRGAIRSAPSSSRATPRANPVRILGGSVVDLQGGARVEIVGEIQVPGIAIKISSAEFGEAIVRGKIQTANGRTSATSLRGGEDAGNITIGGYFGRNKKVDVRGAELLAGDGGAGFSPKSASFNVLNVRNPCQDHGGTSRREGYIYTASDGGKGGGVRLIGETIVAAQATIRPGDGGPGGAVGTAKRADAIDGISAHAGADLYATSGSGGEGGEVRLDGDYAGPVAHAGRGGNAGSVRASAGNGAPGCDGGRTGISVGRPGEQGAHKGKAAKPPRSGGLLGALDLADGGNGGSAANVNQSAGDGGAVALAFQTSRPKHPRDPKPSFGGFYAGKITILRYANGGTGHFDCKDEGAATRGTDGGAGAKLTVRRIPMSISKSFNGGDGGNGAPPGEAGAAGTLGNTGAKPAGSFQPGLRGQPCGTGTQGLHRFTMIGTPPQMTWGWPPDMDGNRQQRSFTIDSAEACGPGDPSDLIWQLNVNGGFPTSADFPHNNPAKIGHNVYGNNEATVDAYVTISLAPQPRLTLTAQKTGDVAGPTINPDIASITSTAVGSCS
jgi:hypothetical protein